MNLVQVLLLTFVFLQSTDQGALEQVMNISSEEESALTIIIPSTTDFAVKLYSFIAESEGNKIVSPLSIQIILALVFFGAKEVTATELATLLFLLKIKNETALMGYKSLIRIVQDPTLNLANKMFVEITAPVKEEFQIIAEEYFFSSAESLDFITAPEKSREYINSWVEVQTKDTIKDLLPTGTITGDTRLVLVNAIHFKANWKTKFDESKTREQSFYLSSTETFQVQMMNIKSDFHYLDDYEIDAKWLRLDYEGGKFEMIIVLPNNPEGIYDFESKLENITVFERLQNTISTTVNVYLPKFKMEKTLRLNDVLKSMGVATMFSDSAEFSGIAEERVKVSDVIQKAFIEVTEEGTEVAAASAIVMNRITSVEFETPREITFRADHPFLFIIALKEHQIPVFCGRYAGPE